MTLSTGQDIVLKSGGRSAPIKDFPRAAVVGRGFESEAAAREVAEKAKRALLSCMVKNRMGVDFGDGKQRSVTTTLGLQMLEKEHGVPFRNDIHGIDIYQEVANLRFIHVDVQGQARKDAKHFAELFSQEFNKERTVTEKQLLATELYGSSWFDITSRSRFITLITAVEALLKAEKKADDAIQLIDAFMSTIERSALDDDLKKSLKSSIERLRYQSIGQAGRMLAERLLPTATFNGKPAASFFSHCYNVRSTIVHEGMIPTSVDIDQLVNQTEEFVSQLLIASLDS